MKPKYKLTEENAPEYAQYMINVSRINVKKKYFSWNDVLKRRKLRNEYILLYKMSKDVDWVFYFIDSKPFIS